MPGYDIETLLSWETLTAQYRKSGTMGNYPLTTRFFTSPQNVDSDNYTLIAFDKVNEPSPLNTKGASARPQALTGGTERTATLFYSFNERTLKADALRFLRQYESYEIQQKGIDEVERQQEAQRIREQNQKEAVISLILSYGRVCIDADGNVLPPTETAATGALTDATGTVQSADFGVSNSHRGKLTIDSSDIIDASWSAATTNIPAHLDQIRYESAKAGSPPPVEVHMNVLDKRYIIANDYFKDWAVENPSANDAVLFRNEIPDLWGFSWHFHSGTWRDGSGNVRDAIPRNKAVIIPSAGPWLRAANGSEIIPTNLNVVAGDLNSLLNQTQLVYGAFSYAAVEHNPVRLKLFTGDTYGLNFADVDAIWMPTVIF